MSFLELFLIAFGLSMDAFAVSICKGLRMKQLNVKKALVVGLYFGVFQALMPLIGYLIGSQFADKIAAFDHWIAFILLGVIGGKMIFESFQENHCADRESQAEACSGNIHLQKEQASLSPSQMLPMAIATSIDALAVGVSFAFLKINILPAISFIGLTTLILSMVGVKTGSVFGSRFQSKAELLGGIVLVLMGLKILLEHLGFLHF